MWSSLRSLCPPAPGGITADRHQCSRRSPVSSPLGLPASALIHAQALLLLLAVQPLFSSSCKYSSCFPLSRLLQTGITIFHLPLSPLHLLPNCLPSFPSLPSTSIAWVFWLWGFIGLVGFLFILKLPDWITISFFSPHS